MKRKLGYSLTEIMLVIGVVAIATLSVIWMYRTVSLNAQVDRMTVALTELIDDVEKGWGNMQSYNGLTASIAESRRLVPATLRGDDPIDGPWGPVELGFAGPLRDHIRIGLDVPGGACFKLIKALAPEMSRIEVHTHDGNFIVVMADGVLDDDLAAQACRGRPRLVLDHYRDGFGRRAMWETW